jgi:2Fe-2S ferredoxin
MDRPMSASDTIPVRIEPLNIILQCHLNETLIRCAWRSGYYWPTICGGIGDCGACQCELIEGNQYAEPMGSAENLFFSTHPKNQSQRPVRLACCMTVAGPMTVFKEGVMRR